MSKIISAEELADLAAIDGEYNFSRVELWKQSAEAELINLTGFNHNTTELSKSQLSGYFAVAREYLQERARTNFLAPNYNNERGIFQLEMRLSLMADELMNLTPDKEDDDVNTQNTAQDPQNPSILPTQNAPG